MDRIERIRAKIGKIDKLVNEVIADLDAFDKAREKRKVRVENHTIPPLDEMECRKVRDLLYEAFLAGNPNAVREFVAQTTREHVRAFCRANNLSVDARRASKERIIGEILQWFAQRKVIQGSAGVSTRIASM